MNIAHVKVALENFNFSYDTACNQLSKILHEYLKIKFILAYRVQAGYISHKSISLITFKCIPLKCVEWMLSYFKHDNFSSSTKKYHWNFLGIALNL